MHSHIGYGTTVEDTPKAHGEPLGPEGVKAAKRFYGWPEDAEFLVPDGVYEHFADGIGARGREAREAWEATFAAYRAAHPDLADEIERMQRRELPDGLGRGHPDVFPADEKGIASRDSSGQVLNARREERALAARRCGGPRPLDEDATDVRRRGRLRARRREAGATSTSASARTLRPRSRTGWRCPKLRPFWSGFLIFSDFARGPIRLSALMEIPVVHIFTHDSIGVGEDGPTHQPVEQLVSLRAIPGLLVFRPARRERGRGDLALRRCSSSESRRSSFSRARRCRRSTGPRWRPRRSSPKARTC